MSNHPDDDRPDDEAARTSETSVNFYQTTRRYNPEDSHLGFIWFRIGTDGGLL
jgi:hypothetical protein